MKKLISIIICIITILLFMSIQAFASSPGKITLSTKDSVKAGEELTVEICGLGLEDGVSGIQGKLTYDVKVLEYVGKKSEKDTWTITGYNENTGIFLAEVLNVSDKETFELNEEVPIVSFTFKVKEDTPEADTNITLSDIVVSPSTMQLENNQVSKKITITKDADTDDKEEQDENEKNNQTSNNQQDNTTFKEEIPKAGLNEKIIFIFISIMIILISSYLGYSKYKDIK